MDKVDGLTNEVRLHNATMNLRGALDHCNDHALKKVLMDELIRKCGLPAYALPTTYAHLSCPSSEKQSGKLHLLASSAHHPRWVGNPLQPMAIKLRTTVQREMMIPMAVMTFSLVVCKFHVNHTIKRVTAQPMQPTAMHFLGKRVIAQPM